ACKPDTASISSMNRSSCSGPSAIRGRRTGSEPSGMVTVVRPTSGAWNTVRTTVDMRTSIRIVNRTSGPKMKPRRAGVRNPARREPSGTGPALGADLEQELEFRDTENGRLNWEPGKVLRVEFDVVR